MRGSPIRKSSDQRSVDSSPRLIAASYVLHRLLVPRHPPCALKNLATQKSHHTTPGRKRCGGPTQTLLLQSQKMLASTVQFSTYDQSPPTCPRRTRHTHGRHSGTRTRWPCQRRNGCPLSQDPTACLRPDLHPPHAFHAPGGAVLAAADDAGRTGQCSTLEHHPRCVQPARIDGPS